MLVRTVLVAFAAISATTQAALADTTDLEGELGRNEVRIYSAPVPAPIGRTIVESSLLDRLETRGYERVHSKPSSPGEFFFGHSTFWIYRPAYSIGSDAFGAHLWGMAIGEDSHIRHTISADRTPVDPRQCFLEPRLLSESFDADRTPRILLAVDDLPEHVWRAVLAIEDHRFFEHRGIDGKAVARALLKNLKSGAVAEGGSTITQQLVKNRDLSPKRSLGRKASEAMRALSLESEFSKEEILQAYLNVVYMGHVDGLGLYGFGAAARAYFSRSATNLDLGRAAALAALIQAPNRLHPVRHPDRLTDRRNLVLDRMLELGWINATQAHTARNAPLGLQPSRPPSPSSPAYIRWIAEIVQAEAPKRTEKGRGAVVESTLDPWLQRRAEKVVGQGLARLRQRHRLKGDAPLQAALVALDVDSGNILAYVASDPTHGDAFDRARKARRQPGSLLKPLLLLEAFQACGPKEPLHPATRIADSALTIDLPSGPWSPHNPDDRFRGVVAVRDALTLSLNIPFVRLARHCGLDEMAARLRKAGLSVPSDPPPSFVLGAIEASPLEMLEAFSVFATPGSTRRPRPVSRISRPSGRGIESFGVKNRRVTGKGSAYLAGWLLREATVSGTAQSVHIDGLRVAAKTGTSSDGRDAWLVGYSGSVMTVVWVGDDDNRPMGLSGSASAGPIWRRFMEVAAHARPARTVPRPDKIREAFVDPETGLRVRSSKGGARPCLFRKGTWPRKNRPILRDKPERVIE